MHARDPGPRPFEPRRIRDRNEPDAEASEPASDSPPGDILPRLGNDYLGERQLENGSDARREAARITAHRVFDRHLAHAQPYREYARGIGTDDPIGLLHTLMPETLATLHDNLRSTIIPAASHSTAGQRALEILEKLSRGSETSQLETGEVIGQGGMGVIRAATQVALGRGVAVKTLKPERADRTAALDLLR